MSSSGNLACTQQSIGRNVEVQERMKTTVDAEDIDRMEVECEKSAVRQTVVRTRLKNILTTNDMKLLMTETFSCSCSVKAEQKKRAVNVCTEGTHVMERSHV